MLLPSFLPSFLPPIAHIGEALQLPALVLAGHPVQQHPLRAVQLTGRHGHLDVAGQRGAGWRRQDAG